jgi:hypothetical protein
MFARYFIEVPLPADQVERALLDSPPNGCRPSPAPPRSAATASSSRSASALWRLAAAPRLPPPRRAGPLPLHDVGPLTWEPVGLEGLLPRLDANIELGPLGEDRTQLAISARYRPPLGVVGHAIDRVLLHRVAEATLKDFLDRVGQAITLSQTGGAETMRS